MVLAAFRIKMTLKLRQNMRLVGHIFFPLLNYLIPSSKSTKMYISSSQKNNYTWLLPGIKFYFSGWFMRLMKNLANIASEMHY